MKNFIVQKIQAAKRDLIVRDSHKKFTSANQKAWKSFLENNSQGAPKGRVLVDALIDHPAYLLSHSMIGNALWKEFSFKPLFLIDKRIRRKRKKICKSFGSDDFVVTPSPLTSMIKSPKIWSETIKLWNNIETGKDLLNLSYKNIHIGDLLYDTYLRQTGEGSIDHIDHSFLSFIFRAVLFTHFYQNIFDSYNIRAVVLGHMVYTQWGILAREALANEANVYSRQLGPKEFTIKKYTNLDEAKEYELRPSQELFSEIWEHHREKAVASGEEYINQRIRGDEDEIDASNAYSNDKEILTKKEVTELLDLNKDKKNVVIMSHVFTDAHHQDSKMLFPDYLTWLRETLRVASRNDSVNWVVKPHPSANRYNCNQTVSTEVEKINPNNQFGNLKVFPSKVNTKTVVECADIIVTAKGTAGLEFPSLGIPAVIAGKTPYSGFGFNIEPNTKEEYFDLLNNMSEIEPLNQETVQRAKVMVFIRFILMPVQTNLIPEMRRTKDYNEEVVYSKAGELMKNTLPSQDYAMRKISEFLKSENGNLLNDWEKIKQDW